MNITGHIFSMSRPVCCCAIDEQQRGDFYFLSFDRCGVSIIIFFYYRHYCSFGEPCLDQGEQLATMDRVTRDPFHCDGIGRATGHPGAFLNEGVGSATGRVGQHVTRSNTGTAFDRHPTTDCCESRIFM